MRVAFCVAVLLGTLPLPVAEGWAQSRSFGGSSAIGGGSVFGGAGLGRPSFGRSPSSGTIIGNGLGGFRTYTPNGSGRFVDNGSGSGRVYGPGNRNSLVIGDGQGNATVYGPGAAQSYYGNSEPAVRRPLSDGVLGR